MHDFRSDLMSGAPDGMESVFSAALATAPAFGHREDPFQKDLETEVAGLLGFEDALLVPTCTVANQISVRIWAERGRINLIADRYCHLVSVESGSTAILNNVDIDAVDGLRGHLTKEQVAAAVQSRGAELLVWLENTHMAHGGTVMPVGALAAIVAATSPRNVPIHVDGSRIWNAVVQSGQAASAVTRGADSLSLSLTKALGAPAGSMLLGGRDFIRRAVEVRSAFGAAWRPVGLVSAAGLHSLRGFEARLKEDHHWAETLAQSLQILCGQARAGFNVNTPDTNILLVHAPDAKSADELLAFLASRDVLGLRLGPNFVRFVVHARTRGPAVSRAVDAFTDFFSSYEVRDHAAV